MARERRFIARLLVVALSAVVVSYAAPAPRTGAAATYDYVAPQVAPPVAADCLWIRSQRF
jgi:hypothetical protein